MQLVFSALNAPDRDIHHSPSAQPGEYDNIAVLRYQAYLAACSKYSQEIKAIQKYIPGWLPKFRWKSTLGQSRGFQQPGYL